MINDPIKGEAEANLIVSRLSKTFSGVVALDDVTITLKKGRTLGLFGPNGSGKTTLVNCLSGVLKPNAGTIQFQGLPLQSMSRERRAKLGLIRTYQNLRLFPELSVAENVNTGLFAARTKIAGAQATELVSKALEDQGLAAFAHRAVGTLPYGLQKRTEIARALIAEPKILLLDEPAAGLGTEDWQSMSKTLREAQEKFGISVLLIDHNVEFVMQLVDELAVLANGKLIITGDPETVLNDSEVSRVYLGGGNA